MTNKKDKEINPNCRICGETEEKAWHLITDCDPIANKSRYIMGKFHYDRTWEVDGLVEFVREPRIAGLMATRRT